MLLRISDLVHMGHCVLAPTYYKLYQALFLQLGVVHLMHKSLRNCSISNAALTNNSSSATTACMIANIIDLN